MAKIILLIENSMLPDFEILLCHISRASDDKILYVNLWLVHLQTLKHIVIRISNTI